jgi:hypothetical protein
MQQQKISTSGGIMAVYEKETKKSADIVMEQAVKFFAGSPPGMTITNQDKCCVSFEGGGGFVNVEVTPKDKGATINLETREWDYWAQRFLEKL